MSAAAPALAQAPAPAMLGGKPVPKKWITDTTGTKMAMQEILGRSGKELADFLATLDTDKSGTVDKREFIRAFNSLFGTGENWATDRQGAGIIFDNLDKDGSGTLEIEELRNYAKPVREPRKLPAKKETLPAFTIDAESELPVTAQLRCVDVA